MNTQHIGAAGVVGAVPTPRARDKGVRQMMAAAKAAGTLDAGTYTSLLAKLDAAEIRSWTTP